MTADGRPLIGFIGLGIMGKPMARNLLKAGYRLVVHNRSPQAVRELEAEGAAAARNPREVAQKTDLVITMLPDSPDVEHVYLGKDGAFEAIRPGWLAIDMSTIDPRVSRELARRAGDHGAHMLDAPVSGGDKGAIAGTLSIMVGGPAQAFERAQPIFAALGKTIVHVGPSGSGQVVKACNQIVVGGVIEVVAEALVLGAKAGVDPERIVQVLQGGLASTRVLEMKGSNMLEGRFEPGFRTRLHLKDLRIALELGREAGVVLPTAAIVEQLMQRMRVAGREGYDHAGLITVLEDLAQFPVRKAGVATAAE